MTDRTQADVIIETVTGPIGVGGFSSRTSTCVHRAGAMAAVTTGSAIVLHALRAEAAEVVLETLEREGFDPTRLTWAHAQESTLAENIALASRGVAISLDAIGTSDDGEMLDRIEHLVAMGAGDRVIVSSDSSMVVHPVEFAYERDISYVHRAFCPKVEARFGRGFRQALTRDNVLRAFGRAGADRFTDSEIA